MSRLNHSKPRSATGMNQVDPGRLTLYCQGPVRLASPGPSSAPMSILVSAILILPARYQSSTFQWSSSLWISTGARRSATGRYIHVPWSLTMNRSTARSLQGAGIVRPAQHSHVGSEEHTSELQSRLHLVCRLL